MKSAVLVFPGSNREKDLGCALKKTTGQEPHFIWHQETQLPSGIDLVALPGGFSYGDYLRCGAIAARSPIMDAVRAHAARGGYVLGICNGFQILCEAQLLPGVLQRNKNRSFICRNVFLKVEQNNTVFTQNYRAGDVLNIPVAHGEGNYTADAETIRAIEEEGRVIFRYVDATGAQTESANFNGSTNSIAGFVNEKRNVLGLMPHPENAIAAEQGSTDGLALFTSLALQKANAA